MPSLLDQALGAVGVTNDTNGAIGATLGLTRALDLWNENNLGLPTSGPGKALRDIIENSIPPQFRNNPNPKGLQFQGKGGEWTALHYADDLVAHHPKFKFIFKVKFDGFGANNEFYYYVHRCDKPNITFEHQDVNYYNFRTRVLTKTIFQPISLTFLDEIGNSVNDFFVKYLNKTSGQASGKWGIDTGFGQASGTKPYERGYSTGKSIIVTQIFANGLHANEFKFINPRIESFQFDELNMEDNAGSLVTMQFSYDSLACKTVSGGGGEGFYTWGNTDLFKGGGTSGLPNAGATSLNEAGVQQATSANGGSQLQGLGLNKYTDTAQIVADEGVSQVKTLPNSLKDVIPSPSIPSLGLTGSIDPGETTLSRDINDTLASIETGANFSTATITGQGGNEGVSSLGPPPGDGGFTILNPGDPLPRNDQAYQNYLAGASSGQYTEGGSLAVNPGISTDSVTVLGTVPGPYSPLPRNDAAYQAYLALPSSDSAAVSGAGVSSGMYAQPLSPAEIASRTGVTLRGPSSTTVGP